MLTSVSVRFFLHLLSVIILIDMKIFKEIHTCVLALAVRLLCWEKEKAEAWGQDKGEPGP